VNQRRCRILFDANRWARAVGRSWKPLFLPMGRGRTSNSLSCPQPLGWLGIGGPSRRRQFAAVTRDDAADRRRRTSSTGARLSLKSVSGSGPARPAHRKLRNEFVTAADSQTFQSPLSPPALTSSSPNLSHAKDSLSRSAVRRTADDRGPGLLTVK
jgi:hypothetical protein